LPSYTLRVHAGRYDTDPNAGCGVTTCLKDGSYGTGVTREDIGLLMAYFGVSHPRELNQRSFEVRSDSFMWALSRLLFEFRLKRDGLAEAPLTNDGVHERAVAALAAGLLPDLRDVCPFRLIFAMRPLLDTTEARMAMLFRYRAGVERASGGAVRLCMGDHRALASQRPGAVFWMLELGDGTRRRIVLRPDAEVEPFVFDDAG
jgi:hypothetical protein